jgi:hypothetical protein
MGTVLHLAVLDHFEPASQAERDLVSATLAEASALLALTGKDPDGAIELCATPGGMTRRLVGRMRKSLPEILGKE